MKKPWFLLPPAALLLASCSAASRPSGLENKLADLAKRTVIPLEAGRRKNPVAGGLSDGIAIYQQSCSVCHGGDGRSQTPIGRGLYPPAMDLTSPHVKKWTDAELFWIIRNGERFTGMPAWKDVLGETQTWQVAAAIRELQKATAKPRPAATRPLEPEELAREGELLFRQENCIGCHRLHGEGGVLGPDLSNEGSRGRNDEWMLGHLLDPPAYSPGSIMPPARNLDQEQLRALTVFLQRQRVSR